MDFIDLIEFTGTFAFAVSGIRMASGKQIDWFGAYIIGLVTAIGGGTLRDLLLNVTPFWMLDVKYFLTTAVALFSILLFKDKLLKLGSTLFLFDTIGLGLFTIVGITKSVDAGLPFWVSIIMGAVTGSVGGVVRDILLNQVPLLFRRDIYALACVAGGGVYFLCVFFQFPTGLTELTAAATVISLRLLAVKFHIHLPQLQPLGSAPKKDTEE
jgi:uncharacterized membrane protein YeiH